jgi:hypothetical protein
VLVGRAPEQAGLKARITAAGDGRGNALIITGEPGMAELGVVQWRADRVEANIRSRSELTRWMSTN